MEPSSNDLPLPGPVPIDLPADINNRRSISIFSRRGSMNFDIMPRHLTSILGHSFGNNKASAGRRGTPDRRRLAIRVVGLQDQQAMDSGCSSAPLSINYEHLQAQTASKRTRQHPPEPSHLPLSAAALERTVPNGVDELRETSQKRVGAWVECVVNSDITFKTTAQRHSPPTPAAWMHSRSRPNLSVVIPSGRQQRPRTGTKSSTAVPSRPAAKVYIKHQHSCSSSTTSAEHSSLDSNGTKTDGSSYSKKSSRTSVESDPRDLELHLDVTKITVLERSAEASKYRLTTFDPKSAGVFDESMRPNLNKPLPSAPSQGPDRIDSHRSSNSLPEAKTSVSGVQAKSEASSRPGSEQSWRRPKLVRTSQSCRSLQRLDVFDNEFMKSNPYLSPPLEGPSSPVDSHASEEQDKVGQIMPVPLQIRRILKRSMSSDSSIQFSTHLKSQPEEQPIEEEALVPMISVTRAQTPSPGKIIPSIPPRSARRDVHSQDDTSSAHVDEMTRGLDRFYSNADTGKIVHTEFEINTPKADQVAFLAPQMPLMTPATPSARISILTPAVDELPASAIASAVHQESWPLRSPTKVHSQRLVAETALLHIMSSLSSLSDLKNTSEINRGMRRVYQENELSLLGAVLENESPAAWELRELSTPSHLDSSATDADSGPAAYTAASYKNHAFRDRTTVRTLKSMVSERCSGFLRPETASALSSDTSSHGARFDEALYRIWCFCIIFGSGKRREEDMAGQLDWLKGGILANQQGCAATVTTSLDFDFNSVLLNPPEHFGRCNRSKLSADDLYDMLEMWNCLAALLRSYVGKSDQARVHGVFESCSIKKGDVEAEAVALEEWVCHILSLGPSAVLKLAEMSDDTNAGFALAAMNGWMKWTPPTANGSRSPFLREAVNRLYEQRKSASGPRSMLSPQEQERKALSRTRVAVLGAEIRAARATSSYKRLPFIDMANERPMSTLTQRSVSNASSATLNCDSAVSSPTVYTASPAISTMSNCSWLFTKPKNVGPAPTRTVSPVAEEPRKQSPEPEMPQPRQRAGQTGTRQPRTTSTEKAVMGVVAMGFTPTQAREALLVTHDADGHHIDRAVNWLLRQS